MKKIITIIFSVLITSSLFACNQTNNNEASKAEISINEKSDTKHYVIENPIVTKITDNVYSIFYSYYSSIVVIGDKGVLISDPANSYRASVLKNEIAKLTKLPITYIVLTHEHYDHVGGTDLFESAKIISQEKAIPVFELDVSDIAPKKVDITFDKDYSVMMGKTKVNILHYGFPSDGISNAFIYLPSEKVVYTADLYEYHELQDKAFIEALNSLGVRKALNKIVALQPKYAIASHSVKIDAEALQLSAEFFNDLYNEIYPKLIEAKAKGYEAEGEFKATFPKTLKMEKYKDFKNYDHLYRHAERMIESISHGG